MLVKSFSSYTKIGKIVINKSWAKFWPNLRFLTKFNFIEKFGTKKKDKQKNPIKIFTKRASRRNIYMQIEREFECICLKRGMNCVLYVYITRNTHTKIRVSALFVEKSQKSSHIHGKSSSLVLDKFSLHSS